MLLGWPNIRTSSKSWAASSKQSGRHMPRRLPWALQPPEPRRIERLTGISTDYSYNRRRSSDCILVAPRSFRALLLDVPASPRWSPVPVWSPSTRQADPNYCDLKFATDAFKSRGSEGESLGRKSIVGIYERALMHVYVCNHACLKLHELDCAVACSVQGCGVYISRITASEETGLKPHSW